LTKFANHMFMKFYTRIHWMVIRISVYIAWYVPMTLQNPNVFDIPYGTYHCKV